MSPSVTRRSYHGWLWISSAHAWEIFHSAWISWSSKTIIVGTVERSQRIAGSLHASR